MSFIIAANWKMHKGPLETKDFFKVFNEKPKFKNTQCLFFVSAINAQSVQESLLNQSFKWGPQNIYPDGAGAYTGENSPEVFQKMGAQYCLIGHSERRTLFNETDEFINLKVKSAQNFQLSPILCVGETLEQRKKGLTLEILNQQILKGLINVNIQNELHIAYEPVWAIGTGEVATLEQVEQAHQYIRKLLVEKFLELNEKIKILYGGSVKPNNSGELAKVANVGGFLVGGASLEPDSLYKIIESSQE
jgi:triosephosphate isomerase (TIM)